ncbi:Wzz/FepE/Etk N-terminal domain-containing protein [Pelagicoccus mobilis]|uniref:Lipopolysaccharide biosynthesis protein n=1 Tax=Pelagicoccus mobilis TaxID=415221 RepID=A0A934RSP6_9BACT|nr:Wzz/FepE/Etk N-terminal domain-containing protein [Pelagicoccus mobilis]MBK1875666.1 hypothetical protein [Pelagicoccus mobilis]
MSDSTPPQHPQYTYPPEDDELSLIDLWNIVWKRKWPWLTFGPLFGIVGTIIALNATVYFKAEATLAPNTDEDTGGGLAALAGQFGGLASMAGINLGGGGSTENAIATLKSRQFLTPLLTTNENLIALFPDEWDSDTKTWTVSKDRRNNDKRPTDQEAYDRFVKSSFGVSQDKKTGIVTVSIELEDPVKAAEWTNALIAQLNAHLRTQARQEAQKNLDYLNNQLSQTQVIEIRESLYGLIESQTKNAMLANAKEDFAFKVIDPAIVPELKSKPKRGLIVIASGFLGGIFGLFLCFVLYLKEQQQA